MALTPVNLLATITIKVFDGADPEMAVDWSGGVPTPEQIERWAGVAKELAAAAEALKAAVP
jgi:hypothetical protein